MTTISGSLRFASIYRATKIQVLGMLVVAASSASLADSFTPYSVNNSGFIVGSYAADNCVGAGCYQAFTYSPMTGIYAFPTPPTGSTSSQFVGINDSGQIVGTYGNSSGNYGFLLSGGTYTGITPTGVRQITPSAPFNGGGASAIGISDNGEIVGQWTTPSGLVDGFTYSGGAFTNTSIFDPLPNSIGNTLYGVNDSGLISGIAIILNSGQVTHSSFLYDGTTFVPINFPGASSTIVQGINDSGEAVGFYVLNGSTLGFTYINGTYTSVMYPGASYTAVFGVSNNGEIVGAYSCTSGLCPFSDPGFYATPTQNGYSFTTVATPEPGTLFLVGGLLALGAVWRRVARSSSFKRLSR